VIARQFVIREQAAAKQALMIVAFEQRTVGQRRPGALARKLFAAAGDDAGQFDDSAFAGVATVAAANAEDGVAERPQHQFARNQTNTLLPAEPVDRLTCLVQSQNSHVGSRLIPKIGVHHIPQPGSGHYGKRWRNDYWHIVRASCTMRSIIDTFLALFQPHHARQKPEFPG
jgi:hypothetical protein